MEIRKIKYNFKVTGTYFYENEIVIFTDIITIISTDDKADTLILNSERVGIIKKNSIEIPIR